jgi:hypothetical protein
MGGPETRAQTRRGGRSAFAHVAKPVVEDGKPFFISGPTATHLPPSTSGRF